MSWIGLIYFKYCDLYLDFNRRTDISISTDVDCECLYSIDPLGVFWGITNRMSKFIYNTSYGGGYTRLEDIIVLVFEIFLEENTNLFREYCIHFLIKNGEFIDPSL